MAKRPQEWGFFVYCHCGIILPIGSQEDFHHVENVRLRRVLLANPRILKPGELRRALNVTLAALVKDAAEQEVPQPVLEKRIEAARDAQTAITRRQEYRAHQTLRKIWSS